MYRKKKKQAKHAKSSPTTGEFFFTFVLQSSTFPDSFKLVQSTFRGGSITFLEINLLPN